MELPNTGIVKYHVKLSFDVDGLVGQSQVALDHVVGKIPAAHIARGAHPGLPGPAPGQVDHSPEEIQGARVPGALSRADLVE